MLSAVRESLLDVEAQKSVFIMAYLKHRLQQELIRQAAEETKHPDAQAGVIVLTGCTFPNYQTTAAADIVEFDKLLILKPLDEANAAGLAMLRRGADKEIDFEKSCAASNAAREAVIRQQLERLQQEESADDAVTNLLEIALTYAEVGAFIAAQSILEKLPYNTIKKMKLYCGKLFFKALHFGESGFIEYLLDHGMNANWVDTGSEHGAYLPLQLVIQDMNRYLINMNQLLTECEQTDEKKTQYGTLSQLTSVTVFRFVAYATIFRKLCSHRADPDKKPDNNMHVDSSPRNLALSLVVEIKEIMKCDDLSEHVRVLFEKAIQSLHIIADYYASSPAQSRQLQQGRMYLPPSKNKNNYQPERPPPGFSYI